MNYEMKKKTTNIIALYSKMQTHLIYFILCSYPFKHKIKTRNYNFST